LFPFLIKVGYQKLDISFDKTVPGGVLALGSNGKTIFVRGKKKLDHPDIG
jgi:hypothetical protein